jgi:hypothetical protein
MAKLEGLFNRHNARLSMVAMTIGYSSQLNGNLHMYIDMNVTVVHHKDTLSIWIWLHFWDMCWNDKLCYYSLLLLCCLEIMDSVRPHSKGHCMRPQDKIDYNTFHPHLICT